MIQSYRDLEVWKSGIEIVKRTYFQTKRFPNEERYGLVSQMQRDAVSIPANIAEGFARRYSGDYKRFCSIALGSCAELETLLVIACDQRYAEQDEADGLVDLLNSESKMLMALIKKIS